MKRTAILLSLLLILWFASTTQAMSLLNYSLDWMIPLTSGGGGDVTSTNYAINYSVGQTAIGDSQSTNFNTQLGFRQTVMYYLHQWLPAIFK
jgi:hypothetical protein